MSPILRICQAWDSTENLDEATAAYIGVLRGEGDPRHWGEDVLSGIRKFVANLHSCFPLSWSLVSAGQANEMPQRCGPMSKESSSP